jgi:hypothetical protein
MQLFCVPVMRVVYGNAQVQRPYRNVQPQHPDGNVQFQYPYGNFQQQFSYLNIDQNAYENLQYYHYDTQHAYPYPFQVNQQLHMVQGYQYVYQSQYNYPDLFLGNVDEYPVQRFPVTYPDHVIQPEQPQDESLITERNLQMYQNLAQRRNQGLQHQYQYRFQPQRHGVNEQGPHNQWHRDEEFEGNFQVTESYLETVDISSERRDENFQELNEELQRSLEDQVQVKSKVEDWLLNQADESGQLQGSVYGVSGSQIIQGADQPPYEMEILTRSQQMQGDTQNFSYFMPDNHSHVTQSQDVQSDQVLQGSERRPQVHRFEGPDNFQIQERNWQTHPVTLDRPSDCLQQDTEEKSTQRSWEISRAQQTQGAEPTAQSKLIHEFQSISHGETVEEIKQYSNIQQVRHPEDITQGMKSERTLLYQQKQDARKAELLEHPLQPEDSRKEVMCLLWNLPERTCTWMGDRSDRRRHVMTTHPQVVYHGNSAELTANGARVLLAYDEMFLCYTFMHPTTDTLHCVTQHACRRPRCYALYQYRCELRAACRYEKIVDTRLVAPVDETFERLHTSGRSVRFDAEVTRRFVGDNLAVLFTVVPAEEF